ncbi:electron transfer flavoprotein subunit beta [Desulfosarcina alkanivorans]|jgi:electron transfer flavoprotein beta subunit|uniref:Electron transfer flavoprotein subunit beta n=1 Tax=Desulfosarcina alkanivorans TaxID=571177 RepID=A0A5K7YU44_9BACT|nr:electron transfer flavoprotein subunit beta/FixA family protein [Desulfosarcina alkanivorans]BBO71810.1 electron transfer flavoprotein subunit beta [Desulfosarcina alkanivorans]
MNIYVCVKHVPDSAATITVEGTNRINEKITFLVNPYDEHALTEAATIRASFPDAEIVAVCLGKPAAENTLRSAMAMGADRGILIETDQPHDSIFTSRALAAAIRTDGRPRIIFTGKESIDSEGMQTHFRVAARLGMPVATNVVKVAAGENDLEVECEREPGTIDVIRMTMPCVLGAGKGLNTPNYPTFPEIVKSRKKPVRHIALSDLAIDPPDAGVKVEELVPAVEQRTPRALTGSAAEVAARIVDILKNEAKVI